MILAGAQLSQTNPTRKHIIKLVRSRICPGSIRNVHCCHGGDESTGIDWKKALEIVAPLDDIRVKDRLEEGSGDGCLNSDEEDCNKSDTD